MAKKTKGRKVNKSAVTGQFVSQTDIKSKPKTTFQQSTKPKKKLR